MQREYQMTSETQINVQNRSLALFKLETDNEPIKFVNRSSLDYIQRNGYLCSGYFTLAKWLYGADPIEIEQRLGLRKGEFGGVAYALVFSRLPRFEEFFYRLTAAYPDGKYRSIEEDFNLLQEEKKFNKRVFDHSNTPAGPYYHRGDGVIHQWRLLKPIPISSYIRTVTSSLRFTRRDGSMENSEPKFGRLRGIDW